MEALIFIILAVLSGIHGYSYVIPASLRTPGICFYNGLILPKGDSQIPMVCQNTNCGEDGSIIVNGCGRISLPNCTLIEDDRLMKSYPDCCEMTYECIDTDGNTYTKEWNQLNPTYPNEESVPSAAAQKKPDYKILSPLIIQLLLFV